MSSMFRFQIYNNNGQGGQSWGWCLKDGDNNIIAKSGELFHKENVEGSIKKIQDNAPCAPIKKESNASGDGYFFEYYEVSSRWHWRLKAGNHEIMAIGKSENETYAGEPEFKEVLNNIKQEMGRASIMWEGE